MTHPQDGFVVVEQHLRRVTARNVSAHSSKSRYTLADLLAHCQPEDFQRTEEDRAWLDMPPVGYEIW